MHAERAVVLHQSVNLLIRYRQSCSIALLPFSLVFFIFAHLHCQCTVCTSQYPPFSNCVLALQIGADYPSPSPSSFPRSASATASPSPAASQVPVPSRSPTSSKRPGASTPACSSTCSCSALSCCNSDEQEALQCNGGNGASSNDGGSSSGAGAIGIAQPNNSNSSSSNGGAIAVRSTVYCLLEFKYYLRNQYLITSTALQRAGDSGLTVWALRLAGLATVASAPFEPSQRSNCCNSAVSYNHTQYLA